MTVCILNVPSRVMAFIRVLQYIHTLQGETPVVLQCMLGFCVTVDAIRPSQHCEFSVILGHFTVVPRLNMYFVLHKDTTPCKSFRCAHIQIMDCLKYSFIMFMWNKYKQANSENLCPPPLLFII